MSEMVLTPRAKERLAEYRLLFESWTRFMSERYGVPDVHQDDELMLCHALDDGIERIKELLEFNGAEVHVEEIQILGFGRQKAINGVTLPTKDGPVQMVFRENRIVNGCVSTKK